MGFVAKVIRWIACPKCGAAAGWPCRTRDGKPYGGDWFVHKERRAPFDEEYQRGLADGFRP